MKLISCHDGKLHALGAEGLRGAAPGRSFMTGLKFWDALAPGEAFARAAVHELLFERGDASPLFVAAMLARCGGGGKVGGWNGGTRESSASTLPILPSSHLPVIWCDPDGTLYPPALAAQGIPLESLYLLRPPNPAELTWAVAECLRCKGVGAVVAAPPLLNKLSARRLQLAAERGGGIGILMRHAGRASTDHAAATRWLVTAAPGERTVQRWKIQLIHGHGGRVGENVFLEHYRETNSVRAVEQLADHGRQSPPAAGRATA
jgi:hypothetical protein